MLIVNNEPASSHDTYNNPTRRNRKYNMTAVVEKVTLKVTLRGMRRNLTMKLMMRRRGGY